MTGGVTEVLAQPSADVLLEHHVLGTRALARPALRDGAQQPLQDARRPRRLAGGVAYAVPAV
jgi:hypothetical protein